jgi:hypothetical protein
MEKDISDLTKYDSDMTQKKPVNKGFFENFLYLRASFIHAGSGGRTRTPLNDIRTYMGLIPNSVPKLAQKKRPTSADLILFEKRSRVLTFFSQCIDKCLPRLFTDNTVSFQIMFLLESDSRGLRGWTE